MRTRTRRANRLRFDRADPALAGFCSSSPILRESVRTIVSVIAAAPTFSARGD